MLSWQVVDEGELCGQMHSAAEVKLNQGHLQLTNSFELFADTTLVTLKVMCTTPPTAQTGLMDADAE
jgi:hypothetical protein